MHLFTLNGLLGWSWESAGAGISAVRLDAAGDTLLCGFDDGGLAAWRLHDRTPLCQFVSAPAPVVCLAISAADGCLLVGTSRADLLVYPALWGVEHHSGEEHESSPAEDELARAWAREQVQMDLHMMAAALPF